MPTNPASAPAPEAPAIPEIAWYHTLELPGGVVTPGLVDCRGVRDKIAVPERLDGVRVLEIGTWDGFWAFELERRGAEVTTVDVPDVDELDWPPRTRLAANDAQRRERMSIIKLGEGFRAARDLLGSQVKDVRLSVYDLSPETVGTYDMVFVGSILVHLRDPVRALAAIRSVAAGPIILNESFDYIPTVLSPRTPRTRFVGGGDFVLWWHSNLAGVRQMAASAGLVPVEESGIFFIPWGVAQDRVGVRQGIKHLFSPSGREQLVTHVRGIPHISLRCDVAA
jgi:tRNA (mo5U34)-methyltransferase